MNQKQVAAHLTLAAAMAQSQNDKDLALVLGEALRAFNKTIPADPKWDEAKKCWRCPVCRVPVYDNNVFCSFCGQAIDRITMWE